MKRSLYLFMTVLLVVLLCMTVCHEAFHNDMRGDFCVICSWIALLRDLVCAAFLAAAVLFGAAAGSPTPLHTQRTARIVPCSTPVRLHVKLTD